MEQSGLSTHRRTIGLTPRENLLACLDHKTPEWVPRTGSFTPAQIERFREKTGGDDMRAHLKMDRLGSLAVGPTRLSTDFSRYHSYYPAPMPPDKTRVDEWGVAWVRGSLLHFEDMVHPLHSFTTVEEFKAYPYPDLTADYRREGLKQSAEEQRQAGLPVIGHVRHLGGTIFENAWYMRGLENMLADFMMNPELAECHLDRITDMAASNAAFLGECGIDVLLTGDDIATQRGMMMSPNTWRKWLKPRLAAVIAAARGKKPDMHVFYHSDGDCRAVIPDLIEIGVTILNPVQPECMDPVWVKKEYGRDLSLWGTIGTQTTMPFGTPAEVRDTVKRMIGQCGVDGGLVVAPTHVIEPDVPWENIVALYEACCEFGGEPG